MVTCHSMNSDIFELITDAAPLMAEAREKHEAIESENAPKNNYWNFKTKEAKIYRMNTMAYLSMRNCELPKRNKEYEKMLTESTGNMKFTDLLKKSMIKAKRNIVDNVKEFFEGKFKSKDINEVINERE